MAKTAHFVLSDIFSPEEADQINFHRHDGVDADYHGVLDYYVDTGAANAYAITPAPALPARYPGMPIYFKAAHANTGASTINDGLGAVAIKKLGPTALAAGDIVAGQICMISWDGMQYQLLNCILPPGVGLEIVNGLVQVKLDGTTLTRGANGLKLTDFVQSIGTNGYVRLPGGLILQWGFVVVAPESTATVTFPLTFPTAMLSAQCTCKYTNASVYGGTISPSVKPISASQMTVIADQYMSGAEIDGVYWRVLGY